MTLEQKFTTLAAFSAFKGFLSASRILMTSDGKASEQLPLIEDKLKDFLSTTTDTTLAERETAAHILTTGIRNCWLSPEKKVSTRSQENSYEY